MKFKNHLASALDFLQSLVPLFLLLIELRDTLQCVRVLHLAPRGLRDLLFCNFVLDLGEHRFDALAECLDFWEACVGFLLKEDRQFVPLNPPLSTVFFLYISFL